MRIEQVFWCLVLRTPDSGPSAKYLVIHHLLPSETLPPRRRDGTGCHESIQYGGLETFRQLPPIIPREREREREWEREREREGCMCCCLPSIFLLALGLWKVLIQILYSWYLSIPYTIRHNRVLLSGNNSQQLRLIDFCYLSLMSLLCVEAGKNQGTVASDRTGPPIVSSVQRVCERGSCAFDTS